MSNKSGFNEGGREGWGEGKEITESWRLKMILGPLIFYVNKADNRHLNQRESIFSNSHF